MAGARASDVLTGVFVSFFVSVLGLNLLVEDFGALKRVARRFLPEVLA